MIRDVHVQEFSVLACMAAILSRSKDENFSLGPAWSEREVKISNRVQPETKYKIPGYLGLSDFQNRSIQLLAYDKHIFLLIIYFSANLLIEMIQY